VFHRRRTWSELAIKVDPATWEAVTQAEQDAEEAGGQSAQQKGRSCRVPVHGERQDQPGGQQGMHDVLQERSTKHVGARFDALRGEDESKATIEEGPVLPEADIQRSTHVCKAANNGHSLRFALAIRQLALRLTKKHKFISPKDDRKRGSSDNEQSQ
jgi:hypothetical protein